MGGVGGEDGVEEGEGVRGKGWGWGRSGGELLMLTKREATTFRSTASDYRGVNEWKGR